MRSRFKTGASSGARVAASVLVGSLLGWGCFDSDQTFKAAESTTTGEPATTTGSTSTTGTTSTTATTGPMGGDTCEDAIECVSGCILDIATSNLPEPDLSCFLDCTQTLSEEEALKLLRLGNCISDECAVDGFCETGGTTGTTGTTGGSTGGSTTTGGGGGGGGPLDPCLGCILQGMIDPMPEGCTEYAEMCRE